MWQKHKGIRTDADDFYRKLINGQRPGTIIDVGANVGTKTEILRNLAGRVVAIEPDPDLNLLLRKRFQWRPSVVVKNCALGDHEGVATLYKYRGSEAYNTLNPQWSKALTNSETLEGLELPPPEEVRVEMTTLDAIMQHYLCVDYVKVDTEGLEYEILSTLQRPVSLISLEFNLPMFFTSLTRSIDYLCALNSQYRFNTVITEPPLRFEFEEWLTGDAIKQEITKAGWRYVELYARC
jgi:FkbM family methyltransferase